MAEHLGELEAAKGKKDEALTTYELGIATISPYDMMGVRKAPRRRGEKVTATGRRVAEGWRQIVNS